MFGPQPTFSVGQYLTVDRIIFHQFPSNSSNAWGAVCSWQGQSWPAKQINSDQFVIDRFYESIYYGSQTAKAPFFPFHSHFFTSNIISHCFRYRFSYFFFLICSFYVSFPYLINAFPSSLFTLSFNIVISIAKA